MSNSTSFWQDNQLIPLRERDNEEYQPSEEEILEYAEHIGLEQEDVLNEQLLMLAYEGIRAKLPPGWEACSTPDEEIVYRNTRTREVFEQHPLDNIYRQKVQQLKRILAKVSQSEGSIIQQELSEIEEDDNELRNQSDVYERGRYNPPHATRDIFRKSINEKNFREIIETENNWTQNSALNKNISSRDIQSGWQPFNDDKLLPSSLLKQIPSRPLQGGLEQYNTVVTQVERAISQRQSSISSLEEISNLQEKESQLRQIQKQIALKSALLQQLKKSNAQKTAKLKKIFARKKKGAHSRQKIKMIYP